jgi:hypothetical protein
MLGTFSASVIRSHPDPAKLLTPDSHVSGTICNRIQQIPRPGFWAAGQRFQVNHKKLFRLFWDGELAVRRRRSRKRALDKLQLILVPDRAN